jgi:hypothetical protein
MWFQPRVRPAGTAWLIAAGVMVPLSFLLLVVALADGSLVLVYLSVLASIAWIPLLVIGLVKRLKARPTPTT